MRRLADDDDEEEETVNTSGMHLEELAQRARARVIKSAGVVGFRICLVFSSTGISGRIYLPLILLFHLLHNHLLWGLFGHLAVPFLFLFDDISWTLMTQTTVTSLFLSPAKPTHIHSLPFTYYT